MVYFLQEPTISEEVFIMETEQNVQQAAQQTTEAPAPTLQEAPTKFCKHCGGKIPSDAVVCTLCGRQVEEVGNTAAPSIVINNSNENVNTNVNTMNAYLQSKAKNKWVAVLICFFLGFLGAHKFYEGKIGMGVLYLFTMGIFGIGALIDFIRLLCKPNPYYV